MRSVVALTLAVLSFAPVPGAALEPLDAEALHATLRDLIDTHPTAKRTNVALKVTDLETGEVLFDQNSDKLFTPASNLKIYTSAAALDLLGPEYRWTTSLFRETQDDKNQTNLLGDPVGPTNAFYLTSGGDPMFDTDQLEQIAEKLAGMLGPNPQSFRFGIAKRNGWESLPLKGPGWMWDDDPDYYNMSIQPLMLNFNVLEIDVRPGDNAGADLVAVSKPPAYEAQNIKFRMASPYFITGGKTTVDGKSTATIDRQPFTDRFDLSGKMALETKAKKFRVTVHNPKDWIAQVFLRMLVDSGLKFSNDPKIVGVYPVSPEALFDLTESLSSTNSGGMPRSVYQSDSDELIIHTQGKTNAEAVKHFLKVSENAVGEMLLLTLSEKFGESEKVSWPSGAKVISDWLVNTAGLEGGSFRLVDGSGLSRYNLISADSSIRLLAYMKNESEHFEPFFDGLPIYQVALPEGGKWGGVPVAEFDAERVFAKPGGMSGVSTISGYVQTLDGRWLAFSLLGNGYIGSSAPVRDLRNQVWAELVRYQPAAAAVPAQ